MARAIVYPGHGGRTVIVSPANPDEIEKEILRTVPNGAPYRIVDDSTIPADRDSWKPDFRNPDGHGSKRPDLSLKFMNQIFVPAKRLLDTLSDIPLAIEPESNILLHQFEGVFLHCNHFAEKNNFRQYGIKKPNLGDRSNHVANSIKHIRSKGKEHEQVNLTFSTIFEYDPDKGYRFIRNTIAAVYIKSGEQFDGIELLISAINKIRDCLKNDKLPAFNMYESNYGFANTVRLFNDPTYAVRTESCCPSFVKKTPLGYLPVDPDLIKLEILDRVAEQSHPSAYHSTQPHPYTMTIRFRYL